ncbi:hypothetical protein [Microbulbifer sp. 2205BS26-8]|uniref:hypothetical protein n=1 Tax=Microbulbifer sp. 2205BS26-8 TaxID=3064386 RepID=UPI0027402F35|nr:hypothetical protein [Microbulbifer sp. 2205BS26-8]MDP5211363.1 hypothetical protein [Microbulbifer sp. 2205BS26-8]
MRIILISFRIIAYFILVGASPISCAQVEMRSEHGELQLVGKWRNSQGSLFGSGWDECEFFVDNKFKCSNYPSEGGLVLPFEGEWRIVGGNLRLMVDDNFPKSFRMLNTNKETFEVYVDKERQIYRQIDSFTP